LSSRCGAPGAAAPYAEAVSRLVRVVGLARSGQSQQAEAEVEALDVLQQRLADTKKLYWVRHVGLARAIASALVARALGHDYEAVALMQDAARTEVVDGARSGKAQGHRLADRGKLAEAAIRPVLFYPVGATCSLPWVKGLTIMTNSIYSE
jgi:hypothetical protein